MYRLQCFDMQPVSELESELRHFFSRLHYIKRQLQQEQARQRLNRIQRARCRQNLFDLEKVEQDFYALGHKEDIRHLYRKVHRYVKLDQERLLYTFGQERVGRCSLFVAL